MRVFPLHCVHLGVITNIVAVNIQNMGVVEHIGTPSKLDFLRFDLSFPLAI